ncbi:M1 family metallopeptidase [Demequina aurantiaca]|uniref:M1 family metallopeptidase n=1 Tax=Demequina aurantiaca TaxID=676200 RepID=UPI003D332728
MTFTAPPLDPYLAGRADPHLSISRYEIELDYKVATNRLDAVARLTGVAHEDLDRIVLSLANLRVAKVVVNDAKPARWTHRGGVLTIRLAKRILQAQAFTVVVTYAGSPGPLIGPWGDVGWEELTDGVIVAGQPDGAPSWIPCHDHPSDKATFRFVISAESSYTVLANGTLTSRTARAGRIRWVYEQDAPMATYLATVQIGRYATVTMDGTVPQHLLVPPHLREAAIREFGSQPRMMALFERDFGPYPFDAYSAVVADDDLEIPLEAQGLSVFGANHADGSGAGERLIAHELAHQWFGNSLTVGRWRDIWLHEGFACYAEWLWFEESGSGTADGHARATHARLAALPQDFAIGDPGPDLMFDDRLYKRGALTLHAVRLTMGDAAFFAMLRSWTERYRHGTVSTEAFIGHASSASGRPLGGLFKSWLDLQELPELPVQ